MTARIIVTDPFAQASTTHDVEAGVSLAEALMAISPSRWNGAAFEIYEGAIGPAGATDALTAPSIRLKDGDVWQVVVVPAEPISTSLIVAAGVTAGSAAGIAITIAVYIAVMAISMAISYLATMLLAPGKQTNKALSSEDQPSALNSLSPPRNAYRLGSRIAEIYGTVRFWPDLIFNATARWEPVLWDWDMGSWSENTRAGSAQHVQAVFCLGRGHYQMGEFQFGDSPISNANGSLTIYPPGVTLPASVTATYPVANLSRQELGGPGSVNMWSSWYEIPSDEVDRIDVQVAFPGGLILSVSGKKVPAGYVERMQADIRIQAERIDEDGNVLESWERQRVVESKTRNELRITFRETVTPGRWRVRVAEVYDFVPYPNGNVQTAMKRTALEGIVGNRTLTAAERTFEHETVLVVEANNLGGPALQNMEAFNLLATRILPTQDVPGVMTEWRGDGRWITAAIHTLTDPFLCNYPMAEVDWPSLHAVQASLDAYPAPYGEGGFHAALDRQMSADEQLMLIARKARAHVFPSGGRITFARDERRVGVSALFNRRNRLMGRGDIGLGLQFAGRDDPDGVVVSFIDADNDYRQDTYTYPEGVTPAAPLNIDLIGAVHKWEVCRRARFELAQIRYRRRSMPLRVTEEGQLLLPYDRTAVVMPWDEGVSDGEVLETDGLSLRLSRVVPEDMTEAARIRLRQSDGRQTALIEVVPEPARGPDWVTLAEAPAFIIFGPTDDQQIGTLYSLSLTDASDKATHWLMTGAEIDESGVSLTLMEDADEVFQVSDDLIDPCLDEDPLRWSWDHRQGGNYNGGPFTIETPPADPGDLLIAVIGSTGPPVEPPPGWTVIRRVDNPSTVLGGPRNLLAIYRTVVAGEPTFHSFGRVGGTLSGGWITRLGVNRRVGSIVFGGFDVHTTPVAVGPSFTLPGIEVGQPNALVMTGLVAGATIYPDPWPVTQMTEPASWVQQNAFSWTPGARPVYATMLYSAQPFYEFTGPTGPMAFTIPASSSPLNNNTFMASVFTVHWDPTTGGVLVPKMATVAARRAARAILRADAASLDPEQDQHPVKRSN